MRRVPLLLVAALVLVASFVSGQPRAPRVYAAGMSYYVAKDGNDGNDGSLARPWLTIQHAVNTVVSGDTVYVRGGVYSEYVYIGTSGAYTGKSGTAGSPITYTAYAGEHPIIDGSGLGDPGWRGLVTIYNVSYVTLSGFEMRNSPEMGLLVFGKASNLTLSNLKIHTVTLSGIYIETSSNFLIESTEVYDTNKVVDSNEQVSLASSSNFEIRNNSFHNSGKNALDIKRGSSNGLVHHNEIWGTNDTTTGIYLDANGGAEDNFKIFANRIHDLTAPAIVLGSETSPYPAVTNVDIYNNLIYNNGTGFAVWPGPFTRSFRIINNTFYKNKAEIAIYGSGSTAGVNSNCVIRNNVIVTSGGYLISYAGYATAGVIEVDHNLYYDTVGAYARDPASILGTSYVQANPLLANPTADFSIPANSPAKDAGSPDGAPTTDYAGSVKPQGSGYDIGAYEFVDQNLLSVNTGVASDVTTGEARLNGSLTSLGGNSTVGVSFEWGIDTTYSGGSMAGNPSPITSVPTSFTAVLKNLAGGTTYYFRAKATGNVTVTGADQTFVTLVPPGTLSVTTTSLADGTVGVAYSQSISATGGVNPYRWTTTSGNLPAGLTFNSSGIVSGVPKTVGGPTTVTFLVTDSTNATATKPLSIAIGHSTWDIDMDGAVNLLDLALVGQHVGESGKPGWIRQDVNCDGLINVLDCIIVAQHLDRS